MQKGVFTHLSKMFTIYLGLHGVYTNFKKIIVRNNINLTTTLRKLLFSLKQLFIKIYQTTCFMVFTNLCFFNGPQIIIVTGML